MLFGLRKTGRKPVQLLPQHLIFFCVRLHHVDALFAHGGVAAVSEQLTAACRDHLLHRIDFYHHHIVIPRSLESGALIALQASLQQRKAFSIAAFAFCTRLLRALRCSSRGEEALLLNTGMQDWRRPVPVTSWHMDPRCCSSRRGSCRRTTSVLIPSRAPDLASLSGRRAVSLQPIARQTDGRTEKGGGDLAHRARPLRSPADMTWPDLTKKRRRSRLPRRGGSASASACCASSMAVIDVAFSPVQEETAAAAAAPLEVLQQKVFSAKI